MYGGQPAGAWQLLASALPPGWRRVAPPVPAWLPASHFHQSPMLLATRAAETCMVHQVSSAWNSAGRCSGTTGAISWVRFVCSALDRAAPPGALLSAIRGFLWQVRGMLRRQIARGWSVASQLHIGSCRCIHTRSGTLSWRSRLGSHACTSLQMRANMHDSPRHPNAAVRVVGVLHRWARQMSCLARLGAHPKVRTKAASHFVLRVLPFSFHS